jgi:hypothetical protein
VLPVAVEMVVPPRTLHRRRLWARGTGR